MREALDPNQRGRRARDAVGQSRTLRWLLAPVVVLAVAYYFVWGFINDGPYSRADELRMLESSSFSRHLHQSNNLIYKDCKSSAEAHRLAAEITELSGWTDEEAKEFQYVASLTDICNHVSMYPWLLHGAYQKLVTSSPQVADHFVKGNLSRAYRNFLATYNSKHGTGITFAPGR